MSLFSKHLNTKCSFHPHSSLELNTSMCFVFDSKTLFKLYEYSLKSKKIKGGGLNLCVFVSIKLFSRLPVLILCIVVYIQEDFIREDKKKYPKGFRQSAIKNEIASIVHQCRRWKQLSMQNMREGTYIQIRILETLNNLIVHLEGPIYGNFPTHATPPHKVN